MRRIVRKAQNVALWRYPCFLVAWTGPEVMDLSSGSLSGLSSFRKNLMELAQRGVKAKQSSEVSVMPVKPKVGQEPDREETITAHQRSERPLVVCPVVTA